MKYMPVPKRKLSPKQATDPKRITHAPAPHEATDSPAAPTTWRRALRLPLPTADAAPPTCAPIPPPASTYPSVVMVTMVYQKEAGMLVNLLADEPFSA